MTCEVFYEIKIASTSNVLLEYGRVCLHVCGPLCPIMSELSSASERTWAAKLKIFNIWPLLKKVC